MGDCGSTGSEQTQCILLIRVICSVFHLQQLVHDGISIRDKIVKHYVNLVKV